MTTIVIPPHEPPTVAIADADVEDNELARRRENKALRARVEHLEAELAKAAKMVSPAITALRNHEEVHNIHCTFHLQVKVSLTTPEVTCTLCGADLDPLDVLREFATKERHFTENLNHLRVEATGLRKEIEQLKKERSSLKAQVKNYQQRVPRTKGA